MSPRSATLLSLLLLAVIGCDDVESPPEPGSCQAMVSDVIDYRFADDYDPETDDTPVPGWCQWPAGYHPQSDFESEPEGARAVAECIARVYDDVEHPHPCETEVDQCRAAADDTAEARKACDDLSAECRGEPANDSITYQVAYELLCELHGGFWCDYSDAIGCEG